MKTFNFVAMGLTGVVNTILLERVSSPCNPHVDDSMVNKARWGQLDLNTLLPFSITKSGGVRNNISKYMLGEILLTIFRQDTIPASHAVNIHTVDKQDTIDFIINRAGSKSDLAVSHLLNSLDISKARDEFKKVNHELISERKKQASIKRAHTKSMVKELNPPLDATTAVTITKAMAIDIIRQDVKNLLLFPVQAPWLTKVAIQKSSTAIKFIRNPTFEDCKLVAAKGNTGITSIPMSMFTKERQRELKLVSLNATKGQSIRYIRNLDEDMKAVAVNLSPTAFATLRNPSERIKRLHAMKWKI